ncbi:MAG: glycosyltransferase family 2 protein, partial [Betaproteobacteria bacterium]|nr:glycosyltransferase family 2 protein [Betaproteobacteria bacterium]
MQITVSSYGKGPSAADGRLRCAVVTPVGPGHELLAEDSAESVAAAFDRNAGPFSDIDIIRVDDTQGLLGRSEARNCGVREAQRRQAQWIFFLDADDLMHPDAFGAMSAYYRDYDAVWGLICELTPDEGDYVEREGQVREIERPEAILLNDPTLTLQMGHFVRTAAAAANPFDTALDCGEDFDYYLRQWERFRCRKAPVPLFLNRRGMHATGARSATGRQWRASVERIIAARCA